MYVYVIYNAWGKTTENLSQSVLVTWIRGHRNLQEINRTNSMKQRSAITGLWYHGWLVVSTMVYNSVYYNSIYG